MFSLRTVVRSLPRNTSRLAVTAPRIARPSLRLRTACKSVAPTTYTAAFSTSRPRYEVNEELAAKLESEIAIETDQQEDDYRNNIDEFKSGSEFEVVDTPGQEEVELVRKFNDETIKVTFSVSDFNSNMDEADAEDPAMYDEDDNPMETPSEGQSGGATTKGSVNQGKTAGGNFRVAPEDELAPADRDELRDGQDGQEAGFPARARVTVTKDGKEGALVLDCIAQDGEMTIDNVYYFPSADMADSKSADGELASRSIYTGPPFGQLDEDLQLLLEKYLDERGINTSMAIFIPEYIDFKENREYIRWLDNMKSFVQ